MAGTYASNTDVSSARSREEIDRTLARFGASAFAYARSEQAASIQFVANERRIRFVLPMPDRNDREFTHHSRGRRTDSAIEAAYEQAVKQRWRSLALMVKAKLAAVEAGIVSFEDEFLAHTVLPSGRTVAEEIGPQVERAYVEGAVRRLEIEQ